MKTFRKQGKRFVLFRAPENIEGARFDRRTQSWSVPASWRTWQELREQGFLPMQSAATHGLWLALLAQGQGIDPSAAERFGQRTLWPFQRHGVGFLNNLTHALLFDEPGTGKTLQAAAWARVSENLLVVCPNTVVSQWTDLLSEEEPVIAKPNGEHGGWLVTNYERVDRVQPRSPFTLIIDEAHYVKNWRSKRSKLVCQLGERAERVLAVTGSPVINRPMDLWNLYVLLKEREKRDFWGFAQAYCGATHNGYGWDFGGATNLDKLRDDMLHFAIRRTLVEVAPSLPGKMYTTLRVELEGKPKSEIAQRDKALLEFFRGFAPQGSGLGNYQDVGLGQADGLGEYQQLRHACALAKAPAAAEWISTFTSGGGGGVAVFSGFIEPLKKLKSLLGDNMLLYTGEQSLEERAEVVNQFRMGGRVLGLTYGAGGVGLDGLQYGSHTGLLLDLPWTTVEIEQAEGRLFRQGQTRPVQIVRIISDSYIEKLIIEALDRKTDIISYLIGRVNG